MKFLYSIVFVAVISLLLQLCMPWWSIVIAAALGGMLFSLAVFPAFLSGFFGTAIVWWSYAWMIDVKNESILSAKISELFHLGNPMILILICGTVAGIVGGFASLCGKEIKRLF